MLIANDPDMKIKPRINKIYVNFNSEKINVNIEQIKIIQPNT